MIGPRPRLTVYERAELEADPRRVDTALAGVSHVPYWLDAPERPEPRPSLAGETRADLLVVGGGFAGLWTALRAKERRADADVVLLEARRVAWAASGRNGGFCESSLTHGEANAQVHAPGEADELRRLGRENLADLIATLDRYGIDCDLDRSGLLNIATEPHQIEWCRESAELDGVVMLDAEQTRGRVDTPIALASDFAAGDAVVLNPAKLAWGLQRVCEELGVRIFEHSPVTGLRRDGEGMRAETDAGSVRADRIALATNAFPSLLRRTRLLTVPVYDYALVTEPLTPAQRAAIGWEGREGVADLSSRFHYLRLVKDASGADRILFGGFDAVYHYGRRIRPEHDVREETFRRLAVHFATMFPQLADVKFTHAWGGAIDTCSRFFAFYSTGFGGRVAQAAGFTGLGVGATRYAADVMLDLLEGADTKRTRLRSNQAQPFPFPPDPLGWAAIRFTWAETARSDRREGRRGPWLRLLDALKMGFDS